MIEFQSGQLNKPVAPNHISSENREQTAISIAQSYPNVRHDFDDCGTCCCFPSIFTPMVVRLGDDISGVKGNFSDAFLSLNLDSPLGLEKTMQAINDLLFENNVFIRKGDLTFIHGTSYAMLVLSSGQEREDGYEAIGSIDTVVEDRHFRKDQDLAHSGFYGACSAISDIGANGGLPDQLFVALVNPPSGYSKFLEGVNEAASVCGIKKIHEVAFFEEADLGEFASVFTVSGKVAAGRQTTLKGLEEDMHIYAVGTMGVSAASDYVIPRWLLTRNLDPSFRADVFSQIKRKALGSDISDGFDKSVRNFLRHSSGLNIEIQLARLVSAGVNPEGISVSLDQIKFGGDDYSLVIATHDLLKGDNIVAVGKVVKGFGQVNYV